jgi:hypothetical protein
MTVIEEGTCERKVWQREPEADVKNVCKQKDKSSWIAEHS